MNNKKVSFWRIFWPSLISGIVLIFLFFTFFSVMISSLFSSKPSYVVKDKTILHLRLSDQINDIGDNQLDFDFTGVGLKKNIGLSDLLYGFEKAAEDDRIKGIYIELDGAKCGFSTATEIRKAIQKFKKESGKFVVAYHKGEVVTLKQYYIASAANENYGFPSTSFEFLGLGSELMFFKGLLDKLEIDIQVIRGPNNDFKSAVEPFFLTEMSDSSRLQSEVFMHNIWKEVKTNISESRNISLADLEDLAENGRVRRASQAAEFKLIDEIKYRDEVLQLLADKVGVEKVEDLSISSFENYARKKFESQQSIANLRDADIAVIIAEGEVSVDGDGLSSNKITKLLRKARQDAHIKTIILRINSPGGSALASDEIWREVVLANNAKKVIVSMGDLAASGGYYIASPASKIFAENTTITGSIGVFGVIPYTGQFMESKLGVTFDKVGTNSHAVLSLNQKLSPKELIIIQEEVNSIYNDFTQRVSDGRGLTSSQVQSIARGRVWTGNDALRIGLVDTIGGLSDAINFAAKELGIEHPTVRYYPKIEKEKWMEILDAFDEGEEDIIKKKTAFPEEITELYQQVKNIEQMNGVQMRLPYAIKW